MHKSRNNFIDLKKTFPSKMKLSLFGVTLQPDDEQINKSKK